MPAGVKYLDSSYSNAHQRMVAIISIIGNSDDGVKSSDLVPFLCENFERLTPSNAKMSIHRLKLDGFVESKKLFRDSILSLTRSGRQVYDEIRIKRNGEMEKES